MVEFKSDHEDEYPIPTSEEPDAKPFFGPKLPVGIRLGDIRAGDRSPPSTDPDTRRRDEDNNLRFNAIGQELEGIVSLLRKLGFVSAQGVPLVEGVAPPGGSSGGGNTYIGGGGTSYPPWISALRNILGKIGSWIQFLRRGLLRLEIRIEELEGNKERNTMSGADAAHLMNNHGFNNGRFFGGFDLDVNSYGAFTIPGTVDTGVLPDAADMWQNRLFGDLTNNRKIHAASSVGDLANFWCANEVGWFLDGSVFRVLDPGGNTPAIRIGYGATSYDLPVADGTAGQVLETDGLGGTSWETPSSGVTDHGALTGLGDDDHSQYLLVDGTRAMTGELSLDGTGQMDCHQNYKLLYTVGTGKLDYMSYSGLSGTEEQILFIKAGPNLTKSYPEFNYDYFKIVSGATAKKLKIDPTNISSSTTRTMEVPDRDIAKEEFIYIGASAPTATEGQLWFHTTDQVLYYYDGDRSKWLSVSEFALHYGKDATISGNTYLNWIDGMTTNGRGLLAPADCTIVRGAVVAQSAPSAENEFRINADSTNIYSIYLGASVTESYENNVDADVDAGEQIRCGIVHSGSNYDDPRVSLWFRWRTT